MFPEATDLENSARSVTVAHLEVRDSLRDLTFALMANVRRRLHCRQFIERLFGCEARSPLRRWNFSRGRLEQFDDRLAVKAMTSITRRIFEWGQRSACGSGLCRMAD